MKKMSEGAEACIYATTIFGRRAILKYRQKKHYRTAELDEVLRTRRTRIEARALIAANSSGVRVPNVMLIGSYWILTTAIEGKTLAEILAYRNAKAPKKVLEDAGRYLAMLHEQGIAHGDYTPANIMVSGNSTYVIDFGLSMFTSAVEDKAIDLLLMKRSLKSKDFEQFIKSYNRHCSMHAEVLKRLGEMERRGRYQARTLLATKSSS